MSLILDALQQAEQERRNAAPADLFSPVPPPAPATPPRTGGWPRIAWAALALAALGGWGAWWLGRQAPVEPGPAATAPRPMAAPAAPAQASLPPEAPLFRPTPAAAPPAVAAPVTSTQPTPGPAGAHPVAAGPSGPVAALPPTPLTASAPPAADLPALADLPADIRATLPSLQVTGHTYSDNPTLRSLMIDGRMFVEGQSLAPGLRLERIGAHRAVFNLRGTRFGLDY